MPGRLNDALAPHSQSELEIEFFSQSKTWPNGKVTVRLFGAAPARRWKLRWDGLLLPETYLLENHWGSCAGSYWSFQYQDIETKAIWTVRYETNFKRTQVRPNIRLYRIEHIIREVI